MPAENRGCLNSYALANGINLVCPRLEFGESAAPPKGDWLDLKACQGGAMLQKSDAGVFVAGPEFFAAVLTLLLFRGFSIASFSACLPPADPEKTFSGNL